MINVPHAFTPEFPADETRSRPCKVPVILTVYDGYMHGANAFDLAVDVEEAFDKICELTWCHQSQIAEWLPWVGRHKMDMPLSLNEWKGMLRRRFTRRAAELGIRRRSATEVFTVTAWGEVPEWRQLLDALPGVLPGASNLNRLRKRLRTWRNC